MTEVYRNDVYKVVIISDALGEDGHYGAEGYGVINLETNVTEHTTLMLPTALFQADALQGGLLSMREEQAKPDQIDMLDADNMLQ